jgi:hypothetical protein
MDGMEILTKAFISFVMVLGASWCFAQETKNVANIKGEWIISNDITPVQARAKAIDQAKAEALRTAGVAEYVAESNLSYKTEKDSQLAKDIHESLTSIDVSGEITNYKVTREEKRINEFGNLAYEVWIDANIILHKASKDPGFNVDVSGIRESYRSPDELIFEVIPTKEGFLNIFILSDKESLHLYPNKFEKQEKFESGKIYKFPRSRGLDYEVSSEGVEVNYLVLLYTKTEIPFMEKETPENILHFVARIDPSQKCLKSYPILIRKE